MSNNHLEQQCTRQMYFAKNKNLATPIVFQNSQYKFSLHIACSLHLNTKWRIENIYLTSPQQAIFVTHTANLCLR